MRVKRPELSCRNMSDEQKKSLSPCFMTFRGYVQKNRRLCMHGSESREPDARRLSTPQFPRSSRLVLDYHLLAVGVISRASHYPAGTVYYAYMLLTVWRALCWSTTSNPNDCRSPRCWFRGLLLFLQEPTVAWRCRPSTSQVRCS